MVDEPSLYKWSSYQCNDLGKQSDLLTPHEEYLKLSENDQERQSIYRDLFKYQLDRKLIIKISAATNKGMAIGGERFKREIEIHYKRRMTPAKMGRPKRLVV